MGKSDCEISDNKRTDTQLTDKNLKKYCFTFYYTNKGPKIIYPKYHPSTYTDPLRFYYKHRRIYSE